MAEKTYSPKEAALAVLKKAQELYGNTTLAKAEHKAKKPLKKDGMGATPPPMPAGQGATLGGIINYPGADKTAPLGKSDEQGQNPDAAADAKLGEQVEQDVHEHEEKNADPAHAEMPMKGHIKLAKFMGRMEHKKSMKAKEMAKPDPMMAKKESDFDKLKNKIKSKEGYSEEAAAATAAKIGREKLGEPEMARRSAEARKKS